MSKPPNAACNFTDRCNFRSYLCFRSVWFFTRAARTTVSCSMTHVFRDIEFYDACMPWHRIDKNADGDRSTERHALIYTFVAMQIVLKWRFCHRGVSRYIPNCGGGERGRRWRVVQKSAKSLEVPCQYQLK